MPTASGSNVFEGAVVVKATTGFFALGHTSPGVVSGISLSQGTGDPNGVVSANLGSLYCRDDDGDLYANTDGATTWVVVGTQT